DLSRGSIERVETDPRLTELHLGGQGTAARTLWDRVPPEIEPFSADNVLVFSTGLLTGAPLPGVNRTSVNSICPQTNLFSHSTMGGFWGAELKFAGYDRIVIRGKSPELVYLWINNDRVEIRDASHLKGKGSQETTRIIREELDQDNAQVAAIGLAGENMVYMASIDHGHSSAARMVGVIMGDKKLKAIAVRGTKDIHIARPDDFFETCLTLRKKASNDRTWEDWLESMFPASAERKYDREISCYSCPKNCAKVINRKDGQRFTYKCGAKDVYQMMDSQESGLGDVVFPVAREYGLDSFSTSEVIDFTLKLLNAGILAENDVPGMPSGTAAKYLHLITIIASREGIGDILANGVYSAARQIGKGAEAFDRNTTKKLEQTTMGMEELSSIHFLMTVTGAKLSLAGIDGSFPISPLPTREEREKFVEDWIAVPDEKFKRYFLDWDKPEDISNEAACSITDWSETMHCIDDSTGLCVYMSSFRGQFGGEAIYNIHTIPHLISLVTGLELDEAELWEIARRNRNLIRAINVRRGLRREDEVLPLSQRTVGGYESEQKLLDDYYRFKGWNKVGIPTKETLVKLGLEYVQEDFEKRGIPIE
ncbi:aldehyde ferredoxin oxidoreductase N-terminal domain-containing protein, partial [Chloroflexota bacterium]